MDQKSKSSILEMKKLRQLDGSGIYMFRDYYI